MNTMTTPHFLLPFSLLFLLLLPLSNLLLVMNEELLATRQCTKLTLHDSRHIFGTSAETTIVFYHGVLLCPLFSTWNCTLLSEHYMLPNRRILFFHSFLLAISGKVHRMGYFYHLDCHCLVIPNAIHNDRHGEHLKMLVCLQ